VQRAVRGHVEDRGLDPTPADLGVGGRIMRVSRR
jgi:hypothetical protein